MKALLVGLALLGAGQALAQRPVPGLPSSNAVVTSCWTEPRYFETLRYGLIDYCRRHLRFQAGKLDCFYFVDEVCWVFLPDTREHVQTRSGGNGIAFPCPPRPEPPVCPRLR